MKIPNEKNNLFLYFYFIYYNNEYFKKYINEFIDKEIIYVIILLSKFNLKVFILLFKN